MPKLTNQTLEKRFQCQHCGETMRTRNGLSGHIQFKHKNAPSQIDQTAQTLVNTGFFLVDAIKAGLNQEEAEVLRQILRFWQPMSDEMSEENNRLNNTDYKNYLIMSLALVQGNHLQAQYLEDHLANAMAIGFKSLSDTMGIVNKQFGLLDQYAQQQLQTQSMIKMLAEEMVQSFKGLAEKIVNINKHLELLTPKSN